MMANNNDNSRIVRKKRKDFSQISNSLIADPTISNDAKALYGIIQYYIEIPDFKLYKNTCKKSFKGGDYTFRNAWKELKDLGYLVQIKEHIDGRYVYCYELLDKLDAPDVDNQHVGNHQVENQPLDIQDVEIQHVEFQQVENQPIYKYLNNNTNLNNTNLNNTIVVEKKTSKGFDIDRLKNSPSVDIQKRRLDEALYNDELSNKAINYLADSCNCFSLKQIDIINKNFTDKEYSLLFNIAVGLLDNDPEYSTIENPKRYLSSVISKCIANYN